MIPADLLARLQEADPGLWEKIAETALSEYEYHDEEFNAWISNTITYTDLFGPAQEAWLQHCLQEAIRARGWYLTQWTQSDPIFPEIECVIHCPIKKEVPSGYKGSLFNDYFGRGDTEAEALMRAYLSALSGERI